MLGLNEPIIILACPRSGSSMTAGLFARHGVWVGTSRSGNEHNPKGFFENTFLKKQLKKEWGTDLLALSENPPEYHPDFREKVEKLLIQDGYRGETWLCKHSALYWRAWLGFNPKFICVRRDIEQTVQSNIDVKLHRGAWSRDDLTDIMRSHHYEMDLAIRKCQGINVYTDDLIERNYRSIREALIFCGINPNEDVIHDFVEPRYWKHIAGTSTGS
jgi:hypothetical protein